MIIEVEAGIDPHVHFRTPGAEYKENWVTGAAAAFAGGITTVLDMPNTSPACITRQAVEEKRAVIDAQLDRPLRYGLYLGADAGHLEQIPEAAECVCGLKIYMGNSTGNLVMEKKEAIDRAFEISASCDLLVAVHAEDETRLQERYRQWNGKKDPALHSVIRDPEAAKIACGEAIELAAKHGARLYIVHVSTRAELELIREAKRAGLPVYAEATPHHLFLDTSAYKQWGTFVQCNPPLRDPADREALMEALLDGTIDTVGSDHAPHTREEKHKPFGEAPSGIAGIEMIFPLLLTEVAKGRLTLERFEELTSKRAREIFRLEPTGDRVIVEMEERAVKGTKSRCGWTPYEGMQLCGWPKEVLVNR